uniref:Large ribosomal subunit protein uL16m n=1 Tax=Salix viminalis TaxID=40686 RepID=A0A6N2MLS8_SALVM
MPYPTSFMPDLNAIDYLLHARGLLCSWLGSFLLFRPRISGKMVKEYLRADARSPCFPLREREESHGGKKDFESLAPEPGFSVLLHLLSAKKRQGLALTLYKDHYERRTNDDEGDVSSVWNNGLPLSMKKRTFFPELKVRPAGDSEISQPKKGDVLYPKRTKYSKNRKGRCSRGCKPDGTQLGFGRYGTKSCKAGRLSYRAIEAARRAIIGQFRRNGKIWVRVLADLPITGKPTEIRMGRGKGNPTGWIARVSTDNSI